VKITLIQPSNIVTETQARWLEPFLPVGLGLLAALLRDQGHRVQILDAYTEGWELRGRLAGDMVEVGLAEEEIAAQVRRFQPQVVGFSVPLDTQALRLQTLARWVKAIHPEIYVVCGGAYPSRMVEKVLRLPEVDAVVLGEAEESFPALLRSLEHGGAWDGLAGVAWKDRSGAFAVRPQREPRPGWDALPLPAWDLLPLKHYFQAAGGRRVPLMTSRGCSGSCAYCHTNSLSGEVRRYWPPEALVAQMRQLSGFFGVNEFLFDDDGLLSDPAWMHEVCDRIIADGLKVQWQARGGVDPAAVNEALLGKMRQAGGRELRFHVASGSRRILRQILNMPLDLYQLEKAIDLALAAGFKVSCRFLLGSPTETQEEIYETLNFAWKLRSRGVEEFRFDPGPALGSDATAPASSPDLIIGAAEVEQIQDTAMREFNSRGLVADLTRRMAPGRKPVRTEERFFPTVAPRPRLHPVIPLDDHTAALDIRS